MFSTLSSEATSILAKDSRSSSPPSGLSFDSGNGLCVSLLSGFCVSIAHIIMSWYGSMWVIQLSVARRHVLGSVPQDRLKSRSHELMFALISED